MECVVLGGMKLDHLHQELRGFIDALFFEFSENEDISHYFVERSHYQAAIVQDMLPLLVFDAVSGRDWSEALPLAASWALNLGAAHWLDNVQDRGDLTYLHASVLSMGIANVALSRLSADEDTIRDLLDAIGRVTAFGVVGQQSEEKRSRLWSRSEYFSSIAGKAAAIISTGIWLGGRLATANAQSLIALKEFGFALGMVMQLSDDSLDLEEDLSNGVYTLPVLDGLGQTDHPEYRELKKLLQSHRLLPAEAQQVKSILESMGTITRCKRVIRAYQIQAATAFTIFPELETYLGSYVISET
jgi:predicted component of type VI protein secretion system